MRLRGRWGGLVVAVRKDRRGNVLISLAAALFPLIAMVGSGVDMARAYTVKTRLQQACDAASLAGRRAMVKDTVDDDVNREATKFFNFNFPQKMLGTTGFAPTIRRTAPGTLVVDAATSVPTSIMRIFGYPAIPLSVSCSAQQSFINVDIVLVLDTTGSMNETLASGQKKIEALRAAAMSLYRQLAPLQSSLQSNGYRLRYAIVPYSQAVNVGRLLFSANASYVNQTASAQYVRFTGASGSNWDPDVSWTTVGIAHSDDWIRSSSYNGCVEERQTVATAAATPNAEERPRMTDLDVNLIPHNDATRWAPADPDPAAVQRGLAACPAEAVRLKAFTEKEMSDYLDTLTPAGSTYLDLGMIWGARFISSGGVFADSPVTFNGMRTNKYMVFLTDGDMDPLALSYTGYSHELMVRRVSVGSNNTNPVKKSVSSANAMKPDLVARHNARFDDMCQVVRNLDTTVSVWTIKLSDAAMDSHLRDCANADQSATVATQDALIAQFSRIGKDISELRLTK